jgi:hypothetical protein
VGDGSGVSSLGKELGGSPTLLSFTTIGSAFVLIELSLQEKSQLFTSELSGGKVVGASFDVGTSSFLGDALVDAGEATVSALAADNAFWRLTIFCSAFHNL